MNIKKLFLAVLLVPILAFSEETERNMSIQTNLISWLSFISFIDVENGIGESYIFVPNIEFQYAINNYLALSITATLQFSRDPISYSQSGNSLSMEYEDDFLYIIKPAVMYYPLETWLQGVYTSIYPVIGQHYVSSSYYDNVYTHIGIGFMTGYQWIYDNGFTMQLGAGISKSKIISHEGNKGKFEKKHDWAWDKSSDFRFAFKVGYSF